MLMPSLSLSGERENYLVFTEQHWQLCKTVSVCGEQGEAQVVDSQPGRWNVVGFSD